MTVSINGTTGISGVDGSASTPALQGSDANTGISFGTDEVAINTNGTQRALVDSSGNVNIDSGTLYVDAVNNLVGVGTSSISSGLSVARYGSQLIPGANVYNIPAGRYHAHLGTAAAGQNLWVGFHGDYNAATGSVNLLLQPTFTDVSQQAGAYIGGEATSAGSTAITFGHLTGGATTSSNATKVERARITTDGHLLIGQSANIASGVGNTQLGVSFENTDGGSSRALWVSRSAGVVIGANRNTNDGTIVSLRQDGTEEGNISVSGTTVSYNGAHLSRWSQIPGIDPHDKDARPEILRGTVMSNLDEMCDWIDPDSGEAQANEQLNKTKISDVEGDKNVAGVFQSWDDDDDTWVNDFYLAMTGDFVIRIAAGVSVERGDLLISAGDGTAKPQADDLIRNSTIAKITSTTVSHVYPDGSYCIPCVLMAC
jgi:hypothetical protein